MNERRKHRAECAADESMYVRNEQRRSYQSRAFHEGTAFALLPPRPRSYTGISIRGSELLSLQVQGSCCPLQQRPNSVKITHRVKAQSRGGGERRLTLLSSLKAKLENTPKPAPWSRTGSSPEMTTQGGAPTVCHRRDPVSQSAETPATPCDTQRQPHRGQPGAAKVSELHLYLPSSLCDDEEQDAAEAEEMRKSAEETSTQGSAPNTANPPEFISPSHSSQEQTLSTAAM